MKLQILRIIDRGVANRERLHLRVLEDTDLSFHIVFDTTYESFDAISNQQRHAYWFPPHSVQAGDHVVLFTGIGLQRSVVNRAGGQTHFFYWGLASTVWNKTGDCAVLFEVETWQTSPYE